MGRYTKARKRALLSSRTGSVTLILTGWLLYLREGDLNGFYRGLKAEGKPNQWRGLICGGIPAGDWMIERTYVSRPKANQFIVEKEGKILAMSGSYVNAAKNARIAASRYAPSPILIAKVVRIVRCRK